MFSSGGRLLLAALVFSALTVCAVGQESELWAAVYDNPSSTTDISNAVAVDAAGNVYIAGYSLILGNTDFTTAKYDALGNELWVVNYASAGNRPDQAFYVALDAAGNVYVTGQTNNSLSNYDCVTVKYDAGGNEQWARVYNGPANFGDYPAGLALDAAGNVYVTGYSHDGTYYEYLTLKYDTNGNELWVRTYDGPGNGSDYAVGLGLDAASNVYVSGYSWGGSATRYDYATVKYDTDGNELWARLYDGGVGADEATALAVDVAGNVYVTGESWNGGAAIDYATVKYDPTGNQQWVMLYGGSASGDDFPTDVTVGPAGDAFVTGHTQGSGSGQDITTIKYSPAGVEVWAETRDGGTGGPEYGNDVCADQHGNVYVTGGTYQPTTDYDCLTLKYGWCDMAVSDITAPDTVMPAAPVTPEAQVCCPGSHSDTSTVHFFIERPGGGFYEDFPGPELLSAGWDTMNVDGGTFNWHLGSANPYSPPHYATVLREPTLLPNDDWLVTPKMRVRESDTIYWRARTVGGTVMESLQVWVSYTDGSPASFQQAIQAFDFNTTTYGLYWADFHNVGDTSVYIGFRYKMPLGLNGNGICIDDIFLRSAYYSESVEVFVAPGDTETVTFPAWDAEMGHYTVRCSVALAGDIDPGNDELSRPLRVDVPPPEPSDWTEKAPMPLAPGGKPVKRGGWLTWNESNGLIYGAKGYKQQDFYRYNPSGNSWIYTGQLPFGLYRGRQRTVKKGSRAIADGNDHLYYTAGNNTNSFYKYWADRDSWATLPDVPAGPRSKRIKGGNDMVYVEQGGTGYVYLLKGYKTEFYRYNTSTDEWENLPYVPYGRKDKYKDGSWLCYDGGRYIYAQQANYYDRVDYEHFMFRYDIEGDTWTGDTLRGMPLYGKHGGKIRKKKTKDGGSAEWYDGSIYALKGGNTQQFFRYDADDNAWIELDTVPSLGVAGRKRRVKYGGDLAHIGGGEFYALKGNKTPEFWYYSVGGALDGAPLVGIASTSIAGQTGRAGDVLAWPTVTNRVVWITGLEGPARVSMYDATGRRVLSRAVAGDGVEFDLGSLARGVYLMKVEEAGRSSTARIVLQR